MTLRSLLTLMLLASPIISYAISCPTNNTYLDDGDSIDQVIAACGKPTTINKINNDVLIKGEMNYANPGTQPVLFTIKGQHVSKIELLMPCKTPGCTPEKVPVNFYTQCSQYIYIGNNVPFVKRACGEPVSIKTEQGIEDTTERLIYSSSLGPNVLIIHNGKLIDSGYE